MARAHTPIVSTHGKGGEALSVPGPVKEGRLNLRIANGCQIFVWWSAWSTVAAQLTIDRGQAAANRFSLPAFSGSIEFCKIGEFLVWSNAPMALACEICGKKPSFGNVISHAHNVRRRRWNPNLRRVKAIVNGAHKHVRVCTRCIRSGRVKKAA